MAGGRRELDEKRERGVVKKETPLEFQCLEMLVNQLEVKKGGVFDPAQIQSYQSYQSESECCTVSKSKPNPRDRTAHVLRNTRQ
jgi:hypothetical protein